MNCIDTQGEEFIIILHRLSKSYQLYQGVYLISASLMHGEKQVPKARGSKSCFEFKEIYYVALMDCTSDEWAVKRCMHKCTQKNTKCFYFRAPKEFNYIFFEIPKFRKEKNIQEGIEQWMYLFNRLYFLENIPEFLNLDKFKEVIEIATYENLTPEENKYINRNRYFEDSYLKKMMKSYNID